MCVCCVVCVCVCVCLCVNKSLTNKKGIQTVDAYSWPDLHFHCPAVWSLRFSVCTRSVQLYFHGDELHHYQTWPLQNVP